MTGTILWILSQTGFSKDKKEKHGARKSGEKMEKLLATRWSYFPLNIMTEESDKGCSFPLYYHRNIQKNIYVMVHYFYYCICKKMCFLFFSYIFFVSHDGE